MDQLQEDLQFFIRHQEFFYILFPERYVAIKNHQVVAIGDTMSEVIANAEAKGHPVGTFQTQLCGNNSDCYTVKIKSW